MKGYAFVEINTNKILYIIDWDNKDISEDCPIQENQYVIELEETLYREIQSNILLQKPLRIKDVNATSYIDMIEELPIVEIPKQPTEAEILQERIALLEQAMNDFILMGGV